MFISLPPGELLQNHEAQQQSSWTAPVRKYRASVFKHIFVERQLCIPRGGGHETVMPNRDKSDTRLGFEKNKPPTGIPKLGYDLAGLCPCRAPENPNLEAFKKSPENLSKQCELLAFWCSCGSRAFSKFSRGWAS